MTFLNLQPVFRAAALACLLACALFGAACGPPAPSAQTREKGRGGPRAGETAAEAAPPVPVTTARAESREVPSYVQATGSLVAEETSDVATQASGQVVSTPVGVGAFVRQGDVVARLNDRDARLRLQQAQAGVGQAVAAVRQAEARLGLTPGGNFLESAIPEVRSAGSNLEQAQAQLRLAEANEKRYRSLVETGDVAMSTYDQYRTARDTARAQVNAARQRLRGT